MSRHLNPAGNAVADLLRDPERATDLSLTDWDRILPMVRRAGLAGRLAHRIETTTGWAPIPAAVQPHLSSALVLANKHQRDVIIETERIALLLTDILGRLVLLKGAAYVAAGLPPAAGRIFNDIDILLPREALPLAESILGFAGWRIGEIDPYDEHYYRRWMHQLPPLMHEQRGTVIDAHHRIVPTTGARTEEERAAAGADLLTRAISVSDDPPIAVLAPPDMVLHSAVHLFEGGEYARGLRDLDDLNLLLRHFGQQPGFWQSLRDRAVMLGLTRPLFYGLRYARQLLGTPVPLDIQSEFDRCGPARSRRALMDALYDRALRSPHPASRDRFSAPALWLLYIRGHHLRMPLRLLVPHLFRKTARQMFAHS